MQLLRVGKSRDLLMTKTTSGRLWCLLTLATTTTCRIASHLDATTSQVGQEGQRYINLNSGHPFVQQPPQRERDREAHQNYYESAHKRERQPSHRKTKLNQIQQNTRINLN